MKVIWKSLESSVEKETLVNGSSSKKPSECSSCSVTIENVTPEPSTLRPFKCQYLEPPCSERIMVIGGATTEIDKCIERVVRTMFTGEECLAKITLPPLDDTQGTIVRLELRVALISCLTCKPIWEWSPEEKYRMAFNFKEAGICLYKLGETKGAFCKFSRACKILITLEPMEDHRLDEFLRKDIDSLRKVLYNNMAECHLICKNFQHTISLCNKVLGRDENNIKALYRRAVANENSKDYEKALADMEKVVLLEPRNSAATEKLVLYKKKVCEAKKNYDNIVRKMFHLSQ